MGLSFSECPGTDITVFGREIPLLLDDGMPLSPSIVLEFDRLDTDAVVVRWEGPSQEISVLTCTCKSWHKPGTRGESRAIALRYCVHVREAHKRLPRASCHGRASLNEMRGLSPASVDMLQHGFRTIVSNGVTRCVIRTDVAVNTFSRLEKILANLLEIPDGAVRTRLINQASVLLDGLERGTNVEEDELDDPDFRSLRSLELS